MATITPTTEPVVPPATPQAPSGSWRCAVAGAVGAGAALAAGELFDGLSTGIPGLVVAAGDWFIDVAPGTVAEQGIETFGTNDKPALVIGVIVIVLAIGALVGRAARTRTWLLPAVFAGFGVFGAWLVGRDPQATPALAAVAALVAAGIGAVVALWLLRLALASEARAGAPAVAESPTDPRHARRAFLGWSGAMAAGSVAMVGAGRRLASADSVESVRESIAVAPASGGIVTSGRVITAAERVDLSTVDVLDGEVPGVSTYITPNDRFYRIDTALRIPQVSPDDWRLTIGGMVDREVELTYDDVLAMELVERTITLSCVSNEVGGDLVGNAVWTGVPLLDVLELAGIDPAAEQVVGRSVDDWTAGFPVQALRDGREALLVVGMNGEPLPVRHGFPVRLVVAGLYGYVSAVKWLRSIELTTWDGFDGYWIPRGWSKEGPMKTASRIDVPERGATVDAGRVAVAGVAWAPTRGIERVEVRVDEGAWQPARLAGVANADTWVQWVFEWDATPGRHWLEVRAVDGTGEVQSPGPVPVAPDGAEGWHRRSVDVR
jgi:DMSO/TMAO reductase YedYZ molybdopterin-dependent catalytic subunit